MGEEGARQAASELEAALRRLQEEAHPERVDAAEAWSAVTRYPLLAELTSVDVALMLGWLALLGGALRARGSPTRRVLVGVAGAALGWLLAPALAAALSGDAQGLVTRDTKRALTDGSIVARRVVFAPIAMGYAETHLGEALRAPTWTRAGRVDEEARSAGPRDHDAGAPADTSQAAGSQADSSPADGSRGARRARGLRAGAGRAGRGASRRRAAGRGGRRSRCGAVSRGRTPPGATRSGRTAAVATCSRASSGGRARASPWASCRPRC